MAQRAGATLQIPGQPRQSQMTFVRVKPSMDGDPLLQ
jgi:hypothetical protein